MEFFGAVLDVGSSYHIQQCYFLNFLDFFNKKQCYKPGRSGAGCSRPQSSLHQNGRTYRTVFYSINEKISKNNIATYGMRIPYLPMPPTSYLHEND